MTYLRLISVVGIVAVLVLATTRSAAAVSGFTGPYELQNWSAIGPGATSKNPSSGPATSATFSYELTGSAVFSDQTWRLSSTAAASGPVTFNWAYSGFHAFFDVRVHLQAFADGPAGTTVTSLVNDGPVNCCTPPSGGFSYSGSAALTVTQGYAFGILAGGSNFDADSRLRGQVTLSNLVAPPLTPALTLGTPTVNGLPAGSAPGPSVPVGGAITLAVPITNSGMVAVSLSATSDVGVLACPAALFPPGTSTTCSMTSTALAGQQVVAITVNAMGTNGQTVAGETTAYYTGIQAAPTITGVSPGSGPTAGGTRVTITGGGFQPGATVTFDGLPATDLGVLDATTIAVTTPAHAAGAVTVRVQNPDGQHTSLPQGFTYRPPAPPPAPPPPPQPMTLTVQVWRQIPPLVSENQTELTIIPVVRGVVQVLVDGTVCGQGVTGSHGRASLVVAADPPTPGCGRDGRTVSFRVNGESVAGDLLVFQSGGQAAATLILPGPMPPPRR